MAQFLQVTLPALLGVAMQHCTIELLEFPGRLGPAYRERFAGRSYNTGGDGVQRALCLLVKRAQRLDLVAKELNTNGPWQRRREEVDDAATMAELPWLFHFCHRLVAKVVKVLQHQREVNLFPGPQIVDRRESSCGGITGCVSTCAE